jgi:hypothetical protein
MVPRPPGANIVTGKWIFKHKFNVDGSLERYKARWVLHGFTQRPNIDFDETFSPVVMPATVRTVLSLALSSNWLIHQLNVKNAFLHGTLSETVYCSQPSGFEDSASPQHVCRLNKSLYGLKQAPRAWYSRFATHLLSLGFAEAKSDTSLFVYHKGPDTTYLLLYVDDIVLSIIHCPSPAHYSGLTVGVCYERFGGTPSLPRDASSTSRWWTFLFTTTVYAGYSGTGWYGRLQTLLHTYRHQPERLCSIWCFKPN